jgi:hypothetical protein
MKTLFYILLVACLISCQKEYPYPTASQTANGQALPSTGIYDTSNMISLWGKFVVVDAVMYVTNSETGQKTSYNHFDATKSRSSLRWGGSMFAIEEIIKDTTTYSFWNTYNGLNGYGKFELNSDSTHHYAVNYVGPYKTIIEDPTHGEQNMGGSARPIQLGLVDKSENLIEMQIQEMEGSINGWNVNYFTVIRLKKIESW